MKTELLGQEKNIVKVKVEFEAEEFATSLNEAIREISGKAKIPGFRKGHISRKVLEMRFGKKDLYVETLEKMLPKAVEQIVSDYDLETIDTPSFDINLENIREGQPFTCELTFEVTPVVCLPELEDIELEKPQLPEITDERIDEAIEGFRGIHATLSPVDRAAGEGDVVSVSCVTHVFDADGETVVAHEPQKSEVEIAESLRKEVREALLGKRKEDRAEATFVVEPEHEDSELAGKKVRYEFTVEEIQERVLPELGPELYKMMTGSEIESEEAFREDLKKRLLAYGKNDIQLRFANAAVELIVERSELDVPDTLLNRELAFLRERDASEAKKRFDLSLEEYFRRSSIDMDRYEQELREEATHAVRRTLVLDEIGKKFEVEVKKAELDTEILRLSAIYGVEPVKMRAMLYRNKDRLAAMAKELYYDKIVQLVGEKVKSKDVGADEAGTETNADTDANVNVNASADANVNEPFSLSSEPAAEGAE
ncbi:MAG: trigger factor [Synergistaceae bacterium]|jgi:trigger factor|nr:trigger factor [Synergistaceae bacterium]